MQKIPKKLHKRCKYVQEMPKIDFKKIMTFLVWVYTYQDFVPIKLNFARLHDRVQVVILEIIFLNFYC